MKTILIPDHIVNETRIEEEIFGKDYKVIAISSNSKKKISDKVWKRCHGILLWHHIELDKQIIDKFDNCEVIVRIGVGFDNVDLKSAKNKNIIVCNIPDYGTNDVADHAVGLMLSLSRGINKYNHEVKYNNKWEWGSAGKLKRLSESTIGIIGFGRIGVAMALRAKSLGMKIIFFDPYVPDGKDKSLLVSQCQTIDELLELSDVVSIHTPLTNETDSMVDSNFLNKMKKTAILINTARGQIFDLDDVYHALKSNVIQGIGTDVLPIEPPDQNHPLIKAWRNNDEIFIGRLIITPHCAFYNQESFIEMRTKAAEEAFRVLNGIKPKNCVN